MIKNKKLLVLCILLILTLPNLIFAEDIIWGIDYEEREITLVFDLPLCENENEEKYGGSVWIENNLVTNSLLDCYREEGRDKYGESKKTCCPMGYTCIEDNGNWMCIQKDILICYQYDNEEDCNSDSNNIARNSISEILKEQNESWQNACITPFYVTSNETHTQLLNYCKCLWVENECKNHWEYRWFEKESGSELEIIRGVCVTKGIVRDYCNTTGFLEITHIYLNSSMEEECGEILVQRIACLSTTYLYFIRLTSVIILILFLVLFYFWFRKKNKKKKSKKKIRKTQ